METPYLQRSKMVRSANFIKDNSRLTVRVPVDVIIKRDECSQAVCNQAIFACIWTLCHIYCEDERLGIEGIAGSINLTQHLRTGTLIIPSMENHPHQTRGPHVHTRWWSLDAGRDRRGVSGWLSISTTADTSSLIPVAQNGCSTVFSPH